MTPIEKAGKLLRFCENLREIEEYLDDFGASKGERGAIETLKQLRYGFAKEALVTEQFEFVRRLNAP